ncbi:MAG: TIGR03986 family CRISPR-associated RAMP protein, partial [Rhizonema sp. PD38]|nr:TIGR03986 family CRISPR-associated RAMP protein [Rhizonema sp. PD38]
MLPRHINHVSEDIKAKAPYNFVELPNKILEMLHEFLPQKNCYLPQNENKYTGRIQCKLTAKSPLYTRCGLLPNDFAKFVDKYDEDLTLEESIEKRKTLSDFFCNPVNL